MSQPGQRTSSSKQRGKKYPDGYLEDWTKKSSKSSVKITDKSVQSTKVVDTHFFTPSATILSTTINQILSASNNYIVSFGTGMVEGSGISINNEGDSLIFHNSGSYRFEFTGEIIPYADTKIMVCFDSDGFTKDMEIFSHIELPEKTGKYELNNISTLLPINMSQNVSVKITSSTNESLVLLTSAKLLIYRVA